MSWAECLTLAPGSDRIPVELFQILTQYAICRLPAITLIPKPDKDATKKELYDPDNHDDVITDLEPDILECEVKWALESITMNKASGGDGIPVELFQILEDDAVKVLHLICQLPAPRRVSGT